MSFLPRLGVNIDHVATLRQLRFTTYPNLLEAAVLVESGGGQQITVHLREDRRHIQPEDVVLLRKKSRLPLNLEMAATPEMLRFAFKIKPHYVCLVPEKRKELTTEGGLNVKANYQRIASMVKKLQDKNIPVSLFIEPDLKAIELAGKMGAKAVEIHTGKYALVKTNAQIKKELTRIEKAARLAHSFGIHVHAGHGLEYENVRTLIHFRTSAGQPLIEEYNIGHSIICRAVLVGMQRAVKEMGASLWAP